MGIKKLAAQSKTLIILHRIYDNWRRRRSFRAGNTVTSYGSTHQSWSLDKSLRYIETLYEEYLQYSGLSEEAFRGKTILEVGPGDNFGVALKFLAAGAEEVVCLDKFYSERNPEQETRIYKALREKLTPAQREAFDVCIDLDKGIKPNPEKLKYIYGHGVEEADKILKPESFDFIISRAVIHNVYQIDLGLDSMDRLLVPGGYMLHKIDLSDENMFSSRGMHPLTFLTISESVYRLMAADSAKPNRKLINFYRAAMAARGYQSKLFVSSILGAGQLTPHKENIEAGRDYSDTTLGLIKAIRPKLAAPFRTLPDADLAVSGIFLIARKGGLNPVNTGH
jgi:SAM-dependent methyltransferase